jgi:hypothetical protein
MKLKNQLPILKLLLPLLPPKVFMLSVLPTTVVLLLTSSMPSPLTLEPMDQEPKTCFMFLKLLICPTL